MKRNEVYVIAQDMSSLGFVNKADDYCCYSMATIERQKKKRNIMQKACFSEKYCKLNLTAFDGI